MPSYLHPGVYMEEVPSGARPIESAGTSTAAIIGFATKGPIDEPTLIFSWKEYQEQFGGIVQHSSSDIDYMGHTVRAFFDNGGGKAYICRVADSTAAPAQGTIILPEAYPTTGSFAHSFKFEAKSAGDWANDLVISVVENIPSSTPKNYSVIVYMQLSNGDLVELERVSGVKAASFVEDVSASLSLISVTVPETVSNSDTSFHPQSAPSFIDKWKSIDATHTVADFQLGISGPLKIKLDGGSDIILTITNARSLAEIATQIQSQVRSDANGNSSFKCYVDGSQLVMQSLSLKKDSQVVVSTGANLTALIGSAGSTLTGANGEAGFKASFTTETYSKIATLGQSGFFPLVVNDYEEIFDRLKKTQDVNIILLPGNTYSGTAITIVDAAISHATSMGNRMVIVDVPANITPLKSANDVAGIGPPNSEYSALYYPWMEVPNPFYHPVNNSTAKKSYFIPPSGFAAGLWARTDGARGVWKAPAGLGATVFGALRPQHVVGNDEQDQLNPEGINCIRKILSQPVIWGARTLATKAVPEKRYVPVQRTTLMIKESIYQGIQWAVFEPNDHNLWASLRLNLEAFMDGLHRAGAFQGEKASDAYFVRCGLGSTMTQGDIDAGRVIVEVGFAPLKPAEFVIVRLSQKTAQ